MEQKNNKNPQNKDEGLEMLVKLGNQLLNTYVICLTIFTTMFLTAKYVQHTHPLNVDAVRFEEDLNTYRRYEYNDRTEYIMYARDLRGLYRETLIDSDQNGAPNYKIIKIPNKFVPRIKKTLDNNPNNWKIEKTYGVHESLWRNKHP